MGVFRGFWVVWGIFRSLSKRVAKKASLPIGKESPQGASRSNRKQVQTKITAERYPLIHFQKANGNETLHKKRKNHSEDEEEPLSPVALSDDQQERKKAKATPPAAKVVSRRDEPPKKPSSSSSFAARRPSASDSNSSGSDTDDDDAGDIIDSEVQSLVPLASVVAEASIAFQNKDFKALADKSVNPDVRKEFTGFMRRVAWKHLARFKSKKGNWNKEMASERSDVTRALIIQICNALVIQKVSQIAPLIIKSQLRVAMEKKTYNEKKRRKLVAQRKKAVAAAPPPAAIGEGEDDKESSSGSEQD